jgi:AcrR family transcriptional regulator
LDAAITILRDEGIGALSSVHITQVAGIAQPRFYKYFKNVEACLGEAVAQVVNRKRELFEATRNSLENRSDPEVLGKNYEALFAAVLQERGFHSLLQRYRSDSSALGIALREERASVRDEFIEDLWTDAKRAGLDRRHLPQVKRLAWLVMASIDGCCESVLENPSIDRKAMARELAHYTTAGIAEAFAQMSARPAARRR